MNSPPTAEANLRFLMNRYIGLKALSKDSSEIIYPSPKQLEDARFKARNANSDSVFRHVLLEQISHNCQGDGILELARAGRLERDVNFPLWFNSQQAQNLVFEPEKDEFRQFQNDYIRLARLLEHALTSFAGVMGFENNGMTPLFFIRLVAALESEGDELVILHAGPDGRRTLRDAGGAVLVLGETFLINELVADVARTVDVLHEGRTIYSEIRPLEDYEIFELMKTENGLLVAELERAGRRAGEEIGGLKNQVEWLKDEIMLAEAKITAVLEENEFLNSEKRKLEAQIEEPGTMTAYGSADICHY